MCQYISHPAQSFSSVFTDKEEVSSWKRKEYLSKNEIPFSTPMPYRSLFKTTISPCAPPCIKLPGFWREPLLCASYIPSQQIKLSPFLCACPQSPRSRCTAIWLYIYFHTSLLQLSSCTVFAHEPEANAVNTHHAFGLLTLLFPRPRDYQGVGRDLNFIWTTVSFKTKLHGLFKDLRALLWVLFSTI